jgi:hypothetical protein
MDNNMIRIDDLVRQRLSGGDEPERPGAWLNMRELLDKEMPVTEGYNWRRLIGYLCLLLLVGTATVGGYQWYRSGLGVPGGGDGVVRQHRASGHTNGNDAVSTTGPNTASNMTGSSAQNATTFVASSARPISTSRSGSSTQPAALANARPSMNATPGAAGSPRESAAGAAHRSTLPAGFASGSTAAKNATGARRPDGNSEKSAAALALAEGTRSDRADSKHDVSAPKATPRKTRSAASASSLSYASSSGSSASGMHALPTAAAESLNVPPIEKPRLARIQHDSMQRLEIVRRRVYDAFADRYVYRLDTVPMGKVARNILLPLLPDEQSTQTIANNAKQGRSSGKHAKGSSELPSLAANDARPAGAPEAKDDLAKGNAPVPNAGTDDVPASENSDDAATTNKAAAARHFRLFDMTKLAAAIDKAKSDLARIELYPGVMGGINASLFTPNALGGIQAGITSLFILNDWWSLMTELKYYQRFNTGSSVRDDYMQVMNGTVTFSSQEYKEYDWDQRTIRHGFNYDVVRTFELPVMLRRNWGQAYAQCGLNFALSSAIAVRETSDSLNDIIHHNELRPATHDNTAFVPNDHPLVLTSDFGARFGLGYVISAGYMFTPNIYVDGRITQSFWDNSKTEGAKQVARDLLRTPSIQISVGYRFGPK